MSKVLGLITARGGSKSLPRKNVKELAGKPLMAWTIEAALNSWQLDRTVVTTDDPEIAEVARQWGAEVPFLRPSNLAEDHSSHIGVVLHALEWLREMQRYDPDYVMLLQPTVPFRSSSDIDSAVALALQHEADSVVSVAPCKEHPHLMKQISQEGILLDFVHSIQGDLPRQTLTDIYSLNGAIYLIRPEELRSRRSWYTERTYAYTMPSERSIDIDTQWDFRVADFIASELLRPEPSRRRQAPPIASA